MTEDRRIGGGRARLVGNGAVHPHLEASAGGCGHEGIARAHEGTSQSGREQRFGHCLDEDLKRFRGSKVLLLKVIHLPPFF